MKKIVMTLFLCIFLVFIGSQAFAAIIQEDKVSILGDVDIDRPIKGSVVAILGSIHARYSINGDVVAVLGNVNVESEVTGDVVAVLGNVILGPRAYVYGDVVAIGPGGIQKSPGSQVSGDSVGINFGSFNLPRFRINVPPLFTRDSQMFDFLGNIGFIIISLFSLLIIAVAGQQVQNISESVEEHMIRKLVIGTIIFLGFPIIAILLAITIIGVPVAIIFFGIAFLLGFSAFCVYIGRKILELLNSNANIYGEFIIGAIILAILMATLHFSLWVGILISIISLGLVFDTGFGSRQNNVNSK
ncbi:MAG: hypothetical protein PWQ70_1128 [Clostridiales bacterium]|nr:hypothetical protein [Clostridiales bacterium]